MPGANNSDNLQLDADRLERQRKESWVKVTGSSYCSVPLFAMEIDFT